jgi:hypothetical protein
MMPALPNQAGAQADLMRQKRLAAASALSRGQGQGNAFGRQPGFVAPGQQMRAAGDPGAGGASAFTPGGPAAGPVTAPPMPAPMPQPLAVPPMLPPPAPAPLTPVTGGPLVAPPLGMTSVNGGGYQATPIPGLAVPMMLPEDPRLSRRPVRPGGQ